MNKEKRPYTYFSPAFKDQAVDLYHEIGDHIKASRAMGGGCKPGYITRWEKSGFGSRAKQKVLGNIGENIAATAEATVAEGQVSGVTISNGNDKVPSGCDEVAFRAFGMRVAIRRDGSVVVTKT